MAEKEADSAATLKRRRSGNVFGPVVAPRLTTQIRQINTLLSRPLAAAVEKFVAAVAVERRNNAFFRSTRPPHFDSGEISDAALPATIIVGDAGESPLLVAQLALR